MFFGVGVGVKIVQLRLSTLVSLRGTVFKSWRDCLACQILIFQPDKCIFGLEGANGCF